MGGSANQVINDIEMENSEAIAENPEEIKKERDITTILEIREHIRQIEKAIVSKESRFILRVIRSLPSTRRKTSSIVLKNMAVYIYPSGADRDCVLGFISSLPGEVQELEGLKNRAATKAPVPEVDAYFYLIVLLKLIDERILDQASKCSELLMNKILHQNRRTLDLIAAKSYFYRSYVAELSNDLESIRGFLHARLRTATLRNDFEGQAVIINCLLRNYLHYSLYDQADKLVKKSVYPDTAGNNEWARFLYYLGRIKAAKLEYSVAHKHLVQALRKAPQATAVGFRQTVQKVIIVVEF